MAMAMPNPVAVWCASCSCSSSSFEELSTSCSFSSPFEELSSCRGVTFLGAWRFSCSRSTTVSFSSPTSFSCPGVMFRVASHGAKTVLKNERHFLHSNKEFEYLKEGCTDVLAVDLQLSIPSYNGFVYGVLHAYTYYHSLFIRPDDVWLAIVIQFSLHVHHDPEAMRSFFVEHFGKKPLTLEGFGNLPAADYGDMSRKMASLLRSNLKSPEIADWIIPSFSTTTPHDAVVGSIALMATMKSYIEHKFSLGIGVPAVTLVGTVQDWEDVHRRVVALAGYGETCAMWSNSFLQKITAKLVESRKGQIDEEFWSKICHYQPYGSGTSHIFGWISAFTVFDADGKWQGPSLLDGGIRDEEKTTT